VRSHSVLFDRLDKSIDTDVREEPAFFADLNLDQVLESMIVGREDYDLKPFFYASLHDVAAVRYRHGVLRDLEKNAVSESVGAFAQKMRRMREHLASAEKLRYTYQKESWFLDAVETYCEAVSALAQELSVLDVTSRGLQSFREYLADYTAADAFTSLAAETHKLKDDLAMVRYCVHIRGDRVDVSKYEGEADYSVDVEGTFAKFKQGSVKDYRIKLPDWPDMNHVEARILDLVARLYPDVFLALDEYRVRHHDYLDRTIAAFDREVQFYLSYLEYIERFKAAGLPFCYPHVATRSKEVFAYDAFDLALAHRLVPGNSPVVVNDFHLKAPERILVVTGPNQGGKTTFARMFGQLHHLASLGYPVPGRKAQLSLPDRVFTHFEKEEDLATLSGKLEDELIRVHDILLQATSKSVLIMNESFTSTTLRDALSLGTEVMKQIIELDSLSVCVTFVDELASLSEATVSMVSTVVPDDPALRTYKIVRQPADGLAYAAAIAAKYGLTYESLRKRVAR
jgi:DNA mismatch repair protein MutS